MYLARTTIQTDLIEIQNIPCTVCQECGQEQIGQQAQKKIDKLLERAVKGKLKSRVVVM
jgi:hypothetical protein